ncbi:MAG: hypothetical protein ABI583_01110 [Betaproteobacteria bacterium]
MNSALAKFLTIAAFALLLLPQPSRAEDDETIKVSKLIARYATQLNVGYVKMDWSEQPEVKKVRTFPDVKRSAAILATIWELGKNDDDLFTKIKTDDYQVLLSMLARIHSYTFLSSLLGATANDAVLKNYLEQEITDLKQVFARKNTVMAYNQARKFRDDNQSALLKEPKFVAELVKFREGRDPVSKSLANVTTMLALVQACTTNPAICVKVDVP